MVHALSELRLESHAERAKIGGEEKVKGMTDVSETKHPCSKCRGEMRALMFYDYTGMKYEPRYWYCDKCGYEEKVKEGK